MSQSSTEPEFISLALGICEDIWIQRLLSELRVMDKQPIKLFYDNQAAINIAKSLVHNDKTKHLQIGRHFILEKIENGTVQIVYIPSQHQLLIISPNHFQELDLKS